MLFVVLFRLLMLFPLPAPPGLICGAWGLIPRISRRVLSGGANNMVDNGEMVNFDSDDNGSCCCWYCWSCWCWLIIELDVLAVVMVVGSCRVELMENGEVISGIFVIVVVVGGSGGEVVIVDGVVDDVVDDLGSAAIPIVVVVVASILRLLTDVCCPDNDDVGGDSNS